MNKRKKMVVNLYQVEWNGVDLLNIAKQPNTLTKHGLPNQNFMKNIILN